ncbi:TPA: hypothetical protein ACGXMA_004054 [Bacillus cereus]|uniref:hypothetical protein n=1 Tax=Bacillus cereus TaxID=1396 RepID=UPI00030C67AA|nr:hypothetical protein [Bacillus cereus]MCE7034568.1 hypothetical protein [Bacillus cereus]
MSTESLVKTKAQIYDIREYTNRDNRDLFEDFSSNKYDDFIKKQNEMYKMIHSIQKHVVPPKYHEIDFFADIKKLEVTKTTVPDLQTKTYIDESTHNFSKNKEYVDGGTTMVIEPKRLVSLTLKNESFVQELYSYTEGDVENFIIILKNNSIEVTSRLTDLYWELFDEFDEQMPEYSFEFCTKDGQKFDLADLPNNHVKL